MPESILSSINSPHQLQKLTYPQLYELSHEIRQLIIDSTGKNGGHLASNLGVVELTIALHRVFKSPTDKFVWDVGHQCYTHKILTGRREEFCNLRKQNGLAGFPKRTESEHDAFDTGHSSTSISAALGLLAADANRRVVAIIGDGALTGGMAFEALSHAGQLGLPLIVILNDNNMSIGKNVGGLSRHLSQLSMTDRYQRIRSMIDHFVRRIPVFGERLFALMMRFKRGVKALFYANNFFVDLGFEYVGPIDGHRLRELEEVLKDVRDLNRPVVVHVITKKGKGYEFAEEDPSSFHGIGPFKVEDGSLERLSSFSFSNAFSRAIVALAKDNPNICAITAAMESGTGLQAFRQAFPDRFYDVGIAEQHALTYAAGLAAGGKRPVVALYSTFLQRAMDQLIHDIAIPNLPVCIVLDRAGFVGEDGETHQGLFDIALLRSIPHIHLLSPASAQELSAMLAQALNTDGPVIIRYPKAVCPAEEAFLFRALELGRGVFCGRTEAPILLAYTGSLHSQAILAQEFLASRGIQVELYNLRYIKPMDYPWLAQKLVDKKECYIFEEGILQGGIAQAMYYELSRSLPELCIQIHGAGDSFPAQASRNQLLASAGLDAPAMVRAIAGQTRYMSDVDKKKVALVL